MFQERYVETKSKYTSFFPTHFSIFSVHNVYKYATLSTAYAKTCDVSVLLDPLYLRKAGFSQITVVAYHILIELFLVKHY